MAKSISIKKDLFRFSTVRTPNLVADAIKILRFIFHPNISLSQVGNCEAAPREGGKTAYQAYLGTFGGFTKYSQVRDINLDLYKFSEILYKKQDITQFTNIDVQNLSLTNEQVLQIFNQLFYQVISKTSKSVRQACIQMLVADHVVKHQLVLAAAGLTKVSDIKIVIPQEALRCMKSWSPANCKGELHGVNRLGIVDFRRVEQEVCCYVAGEVSHIENIMAREFKERSTKNLVRTEFTTETTRETEIENLSDTTTATRNELSSEVSNVLEEDKSANYGGSLGVSGKCYGVEISANAYADFSNSNSSSYSNTEAKSYAEEVTRRALERIVQKSSTKRTSKIIKEFEENNKHGFDNRGSDLPITGILRWIDLIYTNRLINYGKRMVLEFLVPEPAAFFREMLTFSEAAGIVNSGLDTKPSEELPLSLEEQGINSANDITINNYENLATGYGIVVAGSKDLSKSISQPFSPNPPIDHGDPAWTHNANINIDPDYEAASVSFEYKFQFRAQNTPNPAHFSCAVGSVSKSHSNLFGAKQWYPSSYFATKAGNLSPKLQNSVPVVITGVKLFTYAVIATITCTLKNSVYEQWQNTVYSQLEAAYNNIIDEANNEASDEVAEAMATTETKEKNIPSGMKRIIEQQELKRACIEMIMRPFCREMGKELNDEIDACGKYKIPKVRLNSELDEYAAQVKFFEQAFDWQIMSYLFYPYYWANKCDWGDLFQQEDDDIIFQAFKQSGMARVLVPVRPESTEAVMYYLETGDIWLGGDLVAETDDDLYLSIADELKVIEGQVEEEWETRVPTTLTLVQQQSAKLSEGGLPCCHDHETNELQRNGILTDTNTLLFLNNDPSTL